ncbi:MAG: hypothetical protein A2V85_07630 [Chloroflexi bacterium RBG_16_72_14]|nr:MAG: hypothetical protein A2V85_07630 [Chloroflexi bacterium RBG_16_72_14]
MTRPDPALRRPHPIAAAVLSAIMALGTLPVPAAVVAAPANTADETAARDEPAAQDEPPAQHPSIAYLEAMEHEDDAITFQPGGRVEVGFAPRADDGWPIDGRAPKPLPPGRASGREMAASPQGSRWAEIGGAAGPTDGAAGSIDQDGAPGAGPGSANPGATPAPTPAPVDAAADDQVIPAEGVAWVAPDTSESDLAAAAGLRRQVFGFLPYWEVSGASTKLNYDVLSTIAYFSVGADKAGNLKKKDKDGRNTTGWGGWTSSGMTAVINAAHQRGTRVVLTISVFAWTTAQRDVQKALLGSASARLTLARQAGAAVRDRGADGVNLDFEPLASGYADEFVALLRTIRSELNRIRSGYQLTYDTTGYIGNYPLEASVGSGAADAIFIMGYDYRTAGSARAGSIDPLSGSTYDLADTVRAYTARVAPSRIILGLPWYGRAWSTESDAVRAPNQSGEKYGYSTAVNYENVVPLVEKHGRRWDPAEQTPYVVYRRENCTTTYGCVTSWRQVYYEDAASMTLRYAMVNDYGLRGAGMWALGYDGGHPELYRAISESFLVDKSGPQAGISMLANTQVDEGFIVSWSAKDSSSIASYDVQVSIDGGAWAAWRTKDNATSDVWLGEDGHGYAFRVRAVDARGNTGAWNVTSTWRAEPALAVGGFGRVRIDGLAYRTGPGTENVKLGTLPLNTIVAITRGPVSEDGYTWWEVTQPVKEWNPVSFVERGVWIAGASSTATYLTAYRAPNSTTVAAGLVDLDFGAGGSAVGTSPAAVATRQLSPNGDGSRDTIRLRWRNTLDLESLQLNVYRADGTLVGSRTVGDVGAGNQAWDWNGGVNGSWVADGRYVLQLSGTAAGKTYRAPSARPVTSAQLAAFGVVVDTVPPKLTSTSASASLISPNGDGTKDTVKLALAASGATSWTVRIAGATGTVRTVSGTGASASFTWDGSDDGGATLPDGAYQATLIAWDNAGNSARKAYPVTVDTTRPAVTPAVSPTRFSPDGDGAVDTVRLSWASSERATGTARVWKGTTLVRSWTVTSLTAWAVTWDGRNASGTRVGDGTYAFRVDVKDPAGNRTVASKNVVVDRTASYLRWSRNFFPQDGDALRPTAALTWRLKRDATTTLRLYDTAGNLVRTVWSGRPQAAGTRSWTWSGKLPDGTYVAQGRYRAELTATSSLGTTVLSRSVWVAGFAVTPSATTVRAGQKLTVTFVTIEPLDTRPVVTFTQPGRTGVSVTATRLSNGSYRAVFTVQSGSVGAASIRIRALDSAGRRNETTVRIAVAS